MLHDICVITIFFATAVLLCIILLLHFTDGIADAIARHEKSSPVKEPSEKYSSYKHHYIHNLKADILMVNKADSKLAIQQRNTVNEKQ